jgi:hypothetical protein
MPNEGTAALTGAQRRAVAAHQPGQDVFEPVLSEDINWKHGGSCLYGNLRVFLSVWAISSMRKSWRHIRPEASSSCRAIRPISTGRNLASTLRK